MATKFDVAKLKLPTLPADYFWAVGDDDGLHYENSGILREYGLEWQRAFGVSIKRNRKWLFFKWVEVVQTSTFKVAKNNRDIEHAAQTVLKIWQSK